MSVEIKTTPLWNAEGTIKYKAPDGKTYEFDPQTVPSDGRWHVVQHDDLNRPVLALRKHNGKRDAELAVSIEDSTTRPSVTLLHDEDDFPRKYYIAADAYNDDNPLNRPALKIKCEGESVSPVPRNAALKVMMVKG